MSAHSAFVRPLLFIARRNALIVCVVAALASGLLAFAAARPAGAASTHWSTNVYDTYHRSVRSGLGKAKPGGSYVTQLVRSKVTPGRGTVGPLVAGHSGYVLLSPRSSNQSLRVGFTLSTGTRSGFGTFISPLLRRQSDGAAYATRLRVGVNGIMRLSIGKFLPGGAFQSLTGETVVPGSAAPGQVIYVEGEVTEQVHPWIGVMAWKAGHRMPTWQLHTHDNNPGRLVGTGSVGFYAYRSNGGSPITLGLHSLQGWRQATPPAPPAPPTTPAPTTPAPTTPAPTTPAPTTPAPTTPAPTTPAPTTPAPTTPAPTTPAPTTPAPTTPAPTTPAPTTPAPTTPAPTTPAPTTPAPTTPAPTTSSVGASTTVMNAGALPLGQARYALPTNGIYVSPDGNDSAGTGSVASPFATINRAVSAASNGSTIVLRGGVYNESVYLGKSVTMEAYPGEVVWMDGSIPVSGWTRSGNTWVHGGWSYQFDHSASTEQGSDAGGYINPAYPMAAYPDQVFADGRQLSQVSGTPGTGQFAVNYANQTITVGSDPTSVSMRASNIDHAFVVGAGNVTLRGFGVRNYATPLPEMGTIYLGGPVGHDLLQDLVVENNATQGISVYSPNVRIDHVDSWFNGMTGIHATASNNLTINACDVTGNNTQHFNSAPAAAGIKVGRLSGFTATNNHVYANVGVTGIWTDENVTNFDIANNVVDVAASVNGPGTENGILNELSDTGVVAGNVISGAQSGYTAFDTGNVRIYNNTLYNNSTWDIGLSQDNRYLPGDSTAAVNPIPNVCPWIVQNIVVADNDFSRSTAAWEFYALDKATQRPADVMNISLDGNLFTAGDASHTAIGWGNGNIWSPTNYATARAWEQAHSLPVLNLTAARGSVDLAALSTQLTDVLVTPPADVAALLGVPSTTQHLGAF